MDNLELIVAWDWVGIGIGIGNGIGLGGLVIAIGAVSTYGVPDYE